MVYGGHGQSLLLTDSFEIDSTVKSSTRCYLAKQPSFRKYHVIITIVCSCNIYHVSENFREYCVGYELMDIVSPQERSIRRPFCLGNK